MMQIAADKNCWLADLENIPSSELVLWMAYYDLEKERMDRHKQRAEREGNRGG